VLRTVTGWLYWITRGLVPAACYWAVWANALGGVHSWAVAAGCGLGSEAVLRSRFYVRTAKQNEKPVDVYKGLFDLVEWYQNLLLKAASDQLAAGRIAYMQAAFANLTSFPELCDKIRLNAKGFHLSGKDIGFHVEKALKDFGKEAAVIAKTATLALHIEYAHELGYVLIELVGRNGFATLVK
jgi:hypothetical protein